MAATLETSLTLNQLAKLPYNKDIPQETLAKVFSEPPFKQVSGAFNLRDLGLVGNVPYVKEGLLYRSGALGYVTEEGKRQLISKLGVKVILDLRSESEVKASQEVEIEGVEAVWFAREKDPKPLDLNLFASGGDKGYSDMYLDILDIYGPSIAHALNYVKDEVEEKKALLFHCTAGKDRTGVLAAIFLSLAGAPDQVIAEDHAVTRVGVEPQKANLMAIVKKWKPSVDESTPGFISFLSTESSHMLSFLEAVREKFESIEGYLHSQLGFSQEHIDQIKTKIKA